MLSEKGISFLILPDFSPKRTEMNRYFARINRDPEFVAHKKHENVNLV